MKTSIISIKERPNGMPPAWAYRPPRKFSRIITAAKGDLSKSAPKYAHQLVAETLLGRPRREAHRQFMGDAAR